MEKNRMYILKKENIQFLIVMLFIYSNFSLCFLQFKDSISISLTIITLLIYMIMCKKKITINKRGMFIFLLVVFLILISCFINNTASLLDMNVIVKWSIAFLMISIFSIEDFAESYIKSLIVICSIVLFLVLIIYPNIFEHFPYIKTDKWIGNAQEQGIHNILVGVVSVNAKYKRNWGIFYEPGMFAFFINIATYFMLFVSKNIKIKYIIIFTIALLTTTSTNGYISMILIYIAYFLKKKDTKYKKEKKKNRKIIWIIFLILIVAIVFFINNTERWYFLVNKLLEFNSSTSSGSGYERINAVKNEFYAFLQNPITGLSNMGVSKFYDGIATFTPLQWFATYGFLFGIICNMAILKFCINKNEKILFNIFRYLAFISMLVSQNMTSNLIILMIILYQKSGYLREENNDNSNSSNL